MMLAAIARPSALHNHEGKIGMWPVGHERPALRGDKRTGLVKGDPLWEESSLDGPRFVEMLVENVIPAMKAAYPKAKVVYLQYDNAPGHRTRSVTVASTRRS